MLLSKQRICFSVFIIMSNVYSRMLIALLRYSHSSDELVQSSVISLSNLIVIFKSNYECMCVGPGSACGLSLISIMGIVSSGC